MSAPVVTGAAVLTPFGDLRATLNGLAQGQTAIRRGAPHAETSAARVEEGPPSDRAAAFLAKAAAAALADAGLQSCVSAYVGTCSGAMDVFEAWWSGRAAARQFYALPLTGAAVKTFSSACTSSLAALWAAARQLGDAPVLVAGADAMCDFTSRGFAALRATDANPCRPFSQTRAGLSFGEGAAALILESAESAKRRGAKVLFTLAGVGLSADAAHRTAPRADAQGLELAVRRACPDPPLADIYVAHGTGTQASDAAELVLGERLGWLGRPWLAHKAFLGHAMGASGLMSVILASAQLRAAADYGVPYDDFDPRLKMRGSLTGCRSAVIGAAAFGGSNAAAWITL